MVTDGRVKELRRLFGVSRTLTDSARMAGMSEKTARKLSSDYRSPTGVSRPRGHATFLLPCSAESL